MASYGSIPDASAASTNGHAETTPLISIAESEKAAAKVLERSLWSRMIFGWFTPILHKGNEKKSLDQEDLFMIPLPDDCSTTNVTNEFDTYWMEEKKLANPSLLRALFRAFGAEFVRAGFLKLVHDLSIFVGPQVLHAIIVFLRTPDAPLWHGLALTGAVTVSQLLMTICLRHYFFKLYATGLRVRTAIVVTVYRKALVLSSGERQTRTLGEITNLMSIDAQRLQDITTYLHALWYSFLQIGLALFFLWQQLGASCLGGVCIIVIMIPLTKYVAQWMGGMQKRLMKAKDERVELNSEVLAGMKVIKFQAWEESFQERILALREVELDQLFRYFVGSTISRMFWTTTPLLVALATFAAYVWSGHKLDVASALTALALFDILRFPLFMLPQIINSTVEASVALHRVRSFLLCNEYKPVGPGDLDDIGIKLKGLTAAYDSKKPKLTGADIDAQTRELADTEWELALLRSQLDDSEKRIQELSGSEDSVVVGVEQELLLQPSNLLCLKRIDFEIKPGELVAVVGGVGCGKSSFINAILGEVRELSGTAAVKGGLAYFSQSPFIMNATVRDNILFGHVSEPVDEDLYHRALDSCALRHDLELLSDGDMTEIGEKGITLSGGQKARVALARAVYHSADVTLVDDALCAVDAHVAKHLFDEVVTGELLQSSDDDRKRSVILVTNAIQFLNNPRVDRIVVLGDGRVVEQGTYAALAGKSDSVFARFLSVLNETGIDGSMLEQNTAAVATGVCVEIPDKQTTGDNKVSALNAPAKLISVEARKTGHVGASIYYSWARAAGGIMVPITILISFALVEGVTVLSNWWITYWSSHGGSGSQTRFLAVYALINLSAAVTGLLRMLLIVIFGVRASRQLFSDLLQVVLHAPMAFFDTTPVGRIVNRFSKDIFTIDEQLMNTLRTYLQTLFNVFSTIVVISGVTPMFTICLIPILIFYVVEQNFFTLTYRELKRLDSVNRSPIYALLGESVDGVAVIRAFSAEESLHRRLTSMLDIQQHAYYLTCAAQSWLAVRLELVGTLIVTFACLSATLEHANAQSNENFAGLAGLAISYALSVTQSLNWSVRMASDMEANMVAVERVQEYTSIETEGSRRTPEDEKLPDSWPTKGDIVFQGAKLRYRQGLPLVLKGLDIHIPAGSKVGVVGRTGAGKSTLMVALMRIVELCEGKILIDGQDINGVGLATLRRNIAVIPQDPVLFSGTVRTNLDPFNDFTDEQLYETLARTGLYTGMSIGSSSHSLSSGSQSHVNSLSDTVAEGGNNFSVGQRQLLVIARALLCGAKIVIMDEATAAVDAETDSAIQKVMRTEFADATTITVAHRLNTIMDSDYILVMSDGRAAEFDTPDKLLQTGGLFRDLCLAAQEQSE